MTTRISENREWQIYLLISLLITLFLFYTDEGYYNFNWMKDPGAWIAFVVYAFSIFAAQLASALLFNKLKLKGGIRILVSSFAGIIAGIIFVISLIFTRW
ncbi:MAG: hypothetical protein DWQ44_04780 [Bacteroidetes bacterium]|nr:MAG: hypothetical protein DWQ33_11010 [Bacteroidota bacterium]REK00619.1 MAG: hypothetical protein DWQ39_10685 [Bacteroidota bacterium]REK35259.1 MAG: hypothetical protein DWQ44_04780 [Bacteroidota bacterium]REK48335.1 MAG: hypothetical protein DWQ48_10980 [Bacteroidota bacterium]